MTKKILLSIDEFTNLTGFSKSYYYDLVHFGRIIRENGLIDAHATIDHLTTHYPRMHKRNISKLLDAREKLKKYKPKKDLDLISAVELQYKLDMCPSTLSNFLKEHKDAPKRISTNDRYHPIAYDRDEVNKFVERHNLLPFSNYFALKFITGQCS